MSTIVGHKEPNQGLRRHKLLTAEIRKALPKLYSQDGKGLDATAYVKFFCPYSGAVWYATEGQPEGDDFTFFGWAEMVSGCGELGYFSLNELAKTTVFGAMRVPAIERDCGWEPRPLRDCERVAAR